MVASVLWLVPAMVFNLDWSGNADMGHNAVALIMILASALFIEVGLKLRSYGWTPVMLVLALLLTYGNTKQAIRNLSLASDHAGDHRKAVMVAASQLSSQIEQLRVRRAEQVKVAGEASVATIKGEVERIKVAGATRWQQTGGCDPDKVTRSREFCSQIAQENIRLSAAIARDKIDEELRELSSASRGAAVSGNAGAAVPTTADPYATNVAAILGLFGYQVSERMIKAEEALVRALTLELVAAFGPSCWAIFMDIIFGVGAAATIAAKKLSNPHVSRPPASQSSSRMVAEPSKADPIDRWLADELEPDPNGVMMASDLKASWENWRDAKGVGHEVSDRALWLRLRKQFKHDKNGNRPRYHGVRKRQPGLRIVSST